MTYIPTFEERPISRSAMLAQAICLLMKESTLPISQALEAMAERRQPHVQEVIWLDNKYKEAFGDYTEHPNYGKDH